MAENKVMKMNMRLLYQLLFYKLYKPASRIRTKEDASFATGLIIGFLFIWWLIIIIDIIDLRQYITPKMFGPAYILSVAGNIYYIMKNRRFEKIIMEMEIIKLPIFYHIIVYFSFLWTFMGFFL